MKTVDFSSAGMSTDIPRPLSGASVAVRNLFVPYRFVPDKRGVGAGAGGDREGNIAAGVVEDGDAQRKVVVFVLSDDHTRRVKLGNWAADGWR